RQTLPNEATSILSFQFSAMSIRNAGTRGPQCDADRWRQASGKARPSRSSIALEIVGGFGPAQIRPPSRLPVIDETDLAPISLEAFILARWRVGGRPNHADEKISKGGISGFGQVLEEIERPVGSSSVEIDKSQHSLAQNGLWRGSFRGRIAQEANGF